MKRESTQEDEKVIKKRKIVSSVTTDAVIKHILHQLFAIFHINSHCTGPNTSRVKWER